VVEPDRRGDVRGQITHTLDDLRAVQSGQDGAQLSGDRGLEREQLLCVIFAGAQWRSSALSAVTTCSASSRSVSSSA
jgi:hypothetical protein